MFRIFKNLFTSTADNPIKEAVKAGAFLVDVRTPAEFSGGSVQAAVNIPLDKIPGQLLQFSKKDSIIVFCRSGNRSRIAKTILEQNGFQNVLNGGTWKKVNRSINK
ncbi:MAG: rhodanese-like domain-containing protein [Ferruginibacter sp.]